MKNWAQIKMNRIKKHWKLANSVPFARHTVKQPTFEIDSCHKDTDRRQLGLHLVCTWFALGLLTRRYLKCTAVRDGLHQNETASPQNAFQDRQSSMGSLRNT